MKNSNMEVVINIKDKKATNKLMGKALGQLIIDKINRFPINHRREICAEIMKAYIPDQRKI